ncbi:Trans-1,2-dihydrobenzene-1,2-diol dehydrogenase-like [Aphelenchoides besseyi]|nr:Trans-1,2-dihydrobenzene-1,2-diol dehydrogenase-like [Aphelenchoides besseyi]
MSEYNANANSVDYRANPNTKMPGINELRWGIIGCGKISHDFARSLSSAKHQHKIVATAASEEERAACLAKKLNLDAQTYGDYTELLKDRNVDIVYIGVINNLHCEWTIKALEAGKHVLCEKPFTCNVKEMKKVYDAAKKSGKFVMEAVWTRFFPVWQKTKEIIKSGELGKPVSFNANFGMQIAENRFHLDKGQSPLIDIGIYCISSSMFCFNDAKPRDIKVEVEKNEDNVDLWGNMTFRYEGDQHSCLYYNGTIQSAVNATLTLEEGRIEFPLFFWCPEQINVFGKERYSKPKNYTFELTDDKSNFNCPQTQGMCYEADHVFEMIHKGATESDVMPLDSSMKLAEVVQEVRAKMGVTYAQD